ncbi:MAG TPA: DnaA regulatory inactivator Hda [Pseudoxanthomonas sp.]
MSVPQLPLALRYPPDQRLENFIAAPQGVIEQLRQLAGVPGSGWLYLAGASGTGKSHLAIALCAAAEQSGHSSAYLPMAAAAGRLEQALQSIEQSDVVALDGLEAIAGNRADEVALFDFHNRARNTGLNLLYVARDIPKVLELVLPDLRSRLAQCSQVLLQPLDDAARAEVLRERAQRRGLAMDQAALDWLLVHADRNLVSLTALLERLDRESLAAQRRVTVPFLRSLLDNAP